MSGAKRRYLNFGHSLAHALESSPGYGHLNHGEAVAIGMRAALRMSQIHIDLDAATVTRLEMLFDRLGFPQLSTQMLSAETLRYLSTDKKKSGGVQRLILLASLGSPKVVECDWSEITRKIRVDSDSSINGGMNDVTKNVHNGRSFLNFTFDGVWMSGHRSGCPNRECPPLRFGQLPSFRL